MERNGLLPSISLVNDWGETLTYETAEIERAGVNAAVITVRLTAINADELAVDVRRAASLLKRRLRPTDRLGGATSDQLSILVTPTNELIETVDRVRRIDDVLFEHRVPAITAFAHRRPEENLVDTWARSQAELDRCLYRVLHGDGISV